MCHMDGPLCHPPTVGRVAELCFGKTPQQPLDSASQKSLWHSASVVLSARRLDREILSLLLWPTLGSFEMLGVLKEARFAIIEVS